MVAESVEVGPFGVTRLGEQPIEAVLDRQRALLDEPVGVEQQSRAGRQSVRCFGVVPVRQYAEWWGQPTVEVLRAPVVDQESRRMSGVREPHSAGVRVVQ